MMRFCLLFLFCPLSLFALQADEEIKVIDQEIATLTPQMKQYQREAANAEVDAQYLLMVHWKAYAKKIQEADQKEDLAKSLERRIRDLKAKRKLLLEQSATPHPSHS